MCVWESWLLQVRRFLSLHYLLWFAALLRCGEEQESLHCRLARAVGR